MAAQAFELTVPDSSADETTWLSWVQLFATTAKDQQVTLGGMAADQQLAVSLIEPWQQAADAVIQAGRSWQYAEPSNGLAEALQVLAGLPLRNNVQPMPVSCSGEPPSTLRIRLQSLGFGAAFVEPAATWVRGIHCDTVILDFEEIDHVSSMLINWVLLLRDHSGLPALRIANASQRVITLLQHLRLDRLLQV